MEWAPGVVLEVQNESSGCGGLLGHRVGPEYVVWRQVPWVHWEGEEGMWVVGGLGQEPPGSHGAVLGAQDFLGQAFVALGEVIGSQRGRLERPLT